MAVLVVFVLACLVGSAMSQCASHASLQGMTCVCDQGFVGDGTTTCGISNAVSVALSTNPASTTSAVVLLPTTSGSSSITITSVTSTNAQFSLYQTDGATQGALIDLTQSGPWSVTNNAGMVFLVIDAAASADTYWIMYSFTDASNATQSDGVAIESFSSCAGLDDLSVSQFGFTTAPEMGDISLTWLASSFQIEFDVTAAYEHDEAIVVIDTVEFDPVNGNVRTRPSGSCSAHAALPSQVPFHALFQAAPTATSTNALSRDYLAYPDPTSTHWSYNATSCSTVTYTRVFALSELGACNNVQVTTGTDSMTGAAIITYAGSIYIHTLQPADDAAQDESAGYVKFSQIFPWQINVVTESEALVQVSTDQSRLYVVVRNIELQGSDMYLLLETQSQYQGLDTALVLTQANSSSSIVLDAAASATAGNAGCTSNTESDTCTQYWVYRKSSWTDSDNAVYTFQWGVYGFNDTDALSVPISLTLRINDVKIVNGQLGTLSLSLFNDLTDAQAGNSNSKPLQYPWHVNERVFVRGDVMLNPTDVSAFTLSYTQLYICYSSVIGYQITLANGGCLDPSLGADNRVQLISNGAIHSDSATTAFQTATNTLTNTASSIAAGVSFEAFPLTGTPQVYTVHAKVLVSSNGKKREIETLYRRDAGAGPRQADTRLIIMPAEQPLVGANNNNNANANDNIVIASSTMMSVGIGAVGVFAVVGLAVVVAVMLKLKAAKAASTAAALSAVATEV